ncbi:TOG array regulator of axonemal microtubules protein 2 [Spea bombifrons]|uniref:TOG array regulator of axonemal microtubules protein 2 n=1 Tax=Spea bombifrons TaxID=233779 RepID=UPI00234BF8AD|nr:TOG array regulator of axonemal microtubules protein 2 [Spea bombifrons]
MAHSDFTTAKYRAPVAVYCGSVPKMKPGYMSLRNGSVDPGLQLCGNRWGAADAAAIQSTLSIQMKRSYLWGGNGDEHQADILFPPFDLEGKKDYFSTEENGSRNQREQEVDSAALETARLKDKLKRKMSEGSGTKGAPTDLFSPTSLPLKPAVSKSASQRSLNATKPFPPIQRSPQSTPSLQSFRPLENGQETTEAVDEQQDQAVASSELKHVRNSAEKKRSLLIPLIPKSSAITPEINPNDPTVSSSMTLLRRHSPDAKQGTSHRSSDPDNTEEKVHSSFERRDLEGADDKEPSFEIGTKNPEHSLEDRPLMANIPNSGKDTELSELGEEGKENTGRINFTISKSAQDKMRQKQLEMETMRQEKRRSEQQIWERLQRMDSGDPAGITSFRLSGVSTVPVINDARRAGANNTLNKWVSRTSLPSIPTAGQDSAANDFRHSSAYSLPAQFLENAEWDSDSENGGPGIGPMSHPEQGMIEALKWLNHKDWEQKEKGLLGVRCLATCHPDVLFTRLHDVSVAVTREVSNLRSKVSRHAIKALGDLFKALKKSMDQEVEEITRVLLHKIGDSNDFIREESDRALGIMVENVSPSRVLAALIASGASHRNSSVRKCSAKHLLDVVELLGSERLLSGSRENTDTFLRTLVKLAQDGQQDTRFYGRRMFSLVMTHPKFEGHMERLIPSHDLRDIIATIKQKEISNSLSELPSAKKHRPIQKSSAPPAQDSQEPDQGREVEVEPGPQESPGPRRQPVRAAEVTEQLKELNKLLTAKEYQSKMEGITLLLDHCKNNGKFVSSNITQIFDSFNPRLQDANKKVNQHALESAAVMIPLLKDSLHHVLVPMITVVTDNLNSKNSGIYSAAVIVVDRLFTHIDHLWLLQPFASRVRFTSGRSMNNVTERLSVLVSSVYPRKPQAVERHVLPVLWYFLSNMTGNGVMPGRNGNFKDVVSKLAKNLHNVMGPSLEEYAAGQPQHAVKMLRDLLGIKH